MQKRGARFVTKNFTFEEGTCSMTDILAELKLEK